MIKTANELAAACLDVAKNYKTLYVMGCFGAPMTEANKTRYIKHHSYNRRAARKKMILAATADTFGFDCVNLIKGLLWGWDGSTDKIYGGAGYAVNGVPDTNADGMIRLCKEVSTDFSEMAVGEVLWCKGHVGIYIGDGLAVECTPSWKNRVQVTAVKNIGTREGYNARAWVKHGKLPYVTYTDIPEVQKPTEAPTGITKGTKVRFKASATTYYPGGSRIPSFVRPYHHIVTQTEVNGKPVTKGGKVCVLLGKKVHEAGGEVEPGINTWVAVENLEVV